MDVATPTPVSEKAGATKPLVSKPWRMFSRISGIAALALFLTPTAYVMKYYMVDQPKEARLTKELIVPANAAQVPQRAQILIDTPDPDNVALQEQVAAHSSDPVLRRRAVLAMAAMVSRPYATLRRPMETLAAKAEIASVAAHDTDAGVRAAASDSLGKIARQGAVIRR